MSKVYDVYECKTPMARHPGRYHTSHVAVLLDAAWQPVDHVPSHAERRLGRYVAAGKTDAILQAKEGFTPARERRNKS